MIFLDFAPLQHRQCTDKDFERWYARGAEGKECLMGHKVSLKLRSSLTNSNGIEEGSWMRCVTSVTSLRTQLVTRRTVLAQKKTMNGMFLLSTLAHVQRLQLRPAGRRVCGGRT
jgi:hypothetical protein